MMESEDFVDPVHGIPVFSLYGTVRRPTPAMMDSFDVLLVDLQDVGCRIYTSSRPFSTCSKRRLGTENRSGCSIGRIRSVDR